MRPPGKKVGTLTVKLERATSRYTRATINVELRLDVYDGTFHAEYENTWYDAKTKHELCDKIRQAAQKTIDVEWTRYLVVDYEARAWPLNDDSGRPEHQGSYKTLSIDDDRATLSDKLDSWGDQSSEHVITSINLHWSVCEFSTSYVLPEDKKKTVRMRREIEHRLADRDDDGNKTYREVVREPCEQEDDKLPAGAVPWTAEREALLRGVLAALGKLDARMVELFRGDPDQLARQLDAASQQDPTRLLAAPKTAAKTKAPGLTTKKVSQPTEPASLGPIADYHERKITEAKAAKGGKHDD